MTAQTLLMVGALMLLGSILLTPLSTRIGIPVLLLFLGVGIVAGESGPGGIQFDDFDTAFLVGNLALAIILLDGGMRTRIQTFRVALRPAATLATLGVAITAGVTGMAAMWLLGLPPLIGLLMGAIVSSTDAAAVFAMLQGRGLNLNERVGATLEIESGSNDPMAIFLTLVLLELIVQDLARPDWMVLMMLVEQFGLGVVGGVAGGYCMTQLVSRLKLVAGLYPLLVLSGGIVIFSGTNSLGGSGFLAIYIAGLWLGNSGLASLPGILQVQDGLAWLAQLGLFLILGLLATPAQLMDLALPGLALAMVLMFVARPLAVLACLWPFGMNRRELGYISWVGLRGAVPIVLALFPIIAGIPEADLLFNVTFILVLLSLLVQGTTLAPLAGSLDLKVPAPRLPRRRIPLELPGSGSHELYLLPVRDLRARVDSIERLPLPRGTTLLAVCREGELMVPERIEKLAPDDWLAVAGNAHIAADIGRLIAEAEDKGKDLAPRLFFGDFVLSGDALLEDLERAYGLTIDSELRHLSLSEVIARRHRGHPVVGDKLALGPVELVVYAVEGDRVTRVGMKLPAAQGR